MTVDLARATDAPVSDLPTPDLFAAVKRIGEYKLAARQTVPNVATLFDVLRPLNGRIDALLREEQDRQSRRKS